MKISPFQLLWRQEVPLPPERIERDNIFLFLSEEISHLFFLLENFSKFLIIAWLEASHFQYTILRKITICSV
jgi:hypothetical protein